MTRIDQYDVSNTYKAEVVDSERITSEESPEEVRHITLNAGAMKEKLSPGQCVGVLVEGPHAFGNEYHLRLYSVAGVSENGTSNIELCVKRCTYVDEISGERYDGIASNHLCDRVPGDAVTLTGPYPAPFSIPEDKSSNLLLIGMGTGIAPFRVLVQHIYEQVGEWNGKVRLFFGARSGLEMLYMNDKKNDFVNYYDEKTFQAFEAVSPRPHLGDQPALDQQLVENRREVWELLSDPKTYVYIAGIERVKNKLDTTFEEMAGTPAQWQELKRGMLEDGRWAELLY
jgi:ferredoxin--NADP+ reductase